MWCYWVGVGGVGVGRLVVVLEMAVVLMGWWVVVLVSWWWWVSGGVGELLVLVLVVLVGWSGRGKWRSSRSCVTIGNTRPEHIQSINR